MGNEIEVEVAFISVDANTGAPVIFLRETETQEIKLPKRLLPIWIGQAEAVAIQLELKGEKPPRPMTHDLMKNLLRGLSAELNSIYVHSMENDTFYGELRIKADGKFIVVDSRPSDALALALRFNAPIYASDELLNENGLTEDQFNIELKRQSDRENIESNLRDLDDESLGRLSV